MARAPMPTRRDSLEGARLRMPMPANQGEALIPLQQSGRDLFERAAEAAAIGVDTVTIGRADDLAGLMAYGSRAMRNQPSPRNPKPVTRDARVTGDAAQRAAAEFLERIRIERPMTAMVGASIPAALLSAGALARAGQAVAAGVNAPQLATAFGMAGGASAAQTAGVRRELDEQRAIDERLERTAGFSAQAAQAAVRDRPAFVEPDGRRGLDGVHAAREFGRVYELAEREQLAAFGQYADALRAYQDMIRPLGGDDMGAADPAVIRQAMEIAGMAYGVNPEVLWAIHSIERAPESANPEYIARDKDGDGRPDYSTPLQRWRDGDHGATKSTAVGPFQFVDRTARGVQRGADFIPPDLLVPADQTPESLVAQYAATGETPDYWPRSPLLSSKALAKMYRDESEALNAIDGVNAAQIYNLHHDGMQNYATLLAGGSIEAEYGDFGGDMERLNRRHAERMRAAGANPNALVFDREPAPTSQDDAYWRAAMNAAQARMRAPLR